MMNFFKKPLNDKSGASAAEYALILALVGVGIIAGVGLLSDSIAGAMTTASEKINPGG